MKAFEIQVYSHFVKGGKPVYEPRGIYSSRKLAKEFADRNYLDKGTKIVAINVNDDYFDDD